MKSFVCRRASSSKPDPQEYHLQFRKFPVKIFAAKQEGVTGKKNGSFLCTLKTGRNPLFLSPDLFNVLQYNLSTVKKSSVSWQVQKPETKKKILAVKNKRIEIKYS